MAKIFHVVPNTVWKLEKNKKEDYSPSTLSTEGFVHLCKADQLRGVLDRFFQKETALTLLRFSETELKDNIVYEAPAEAPNSGQLFPHFYAPIEKRAIEKEFRMNRPNTKEPFNIPENLLK